VCIKVSEAVVGISQMGSRKVRRREVRTNNGETRRLREVEDELRAVIRSKALVYCKPPRSCS
jgi:hypothetical protein